MDSLKRSLAMVVISCQDITLLYEQTRLNEEEDKRNAFFKTRLPERTIISLLLALARSMNNVIFIVHTLKGIFLKYHMLLQSTGIHLSHLHP
jgi:hypothetical protein